MTDTAVPPPPAAQPQGEDKTVAIIAYLTLIGFIVAIIMHQNKKTKLGAYHLRQMLGLVLCSLVTIIPILGLLIFLGVFVLWIFGFLAALKGEMKPVPVLGAQFQKWFGTAFD
jgi:hypothetical protein